jgi:V8-like Glu-specific endopeptidase
LPLASAAQFSAAESLAASSALSGTPGAVAGSVPSGSAGGDTSLAYGSSTAPYTTSRSAVTSLGSSTTAANTPVTSYPWRATGKLYFKIGTGTFVCSASLIKKGILLTAAHCVHNYGQGANGWYNSWVWYPANSSSAGGVYGGYTAFSPVIAGAYYGGTDTCTQVGVVCNNDVALLRVSPKSGVYAGSVVGWYGYGWNGYSYRASTFLGNVTTVQITQLGYPVAFDSGYQQIRTDAVGWYFASGNLKNTQIGSAQTGGSSGGPWLVNFGTVPVVSSSASRGTSYVQAVVGVTSYGSTTIGYNRLGASYFGQNLQFPNAAYGTYGAGNIGRLVQAICTASPTYC